MRPTIRRAAFSALIALGATSMPAPAAWAWDDHRGPQPMASETRGDMHARMQAMHEAREGRRAQDLRTVLRLRPDQEPALSAFLQSHRPPMTRPERRGPSGEATTLTTPQRLDEMARREARHAGVRQRRAEALRAFYAALSPEQRQVFDALQRMRDGSHDHGAWSHRGSGGPPHGPLGAPPPGGPPPRG